MNYTENLRLKKPEQEEFYDVDDFNTNADILDEQITDIKNGYVKKTGDSMSGDLSFDTNHNIHANSDNGQLVFMGGSEWDKGAGIALWGKDKNGAFSIHSVDENGNVKNLCGWNNGSLTWCDKELATQEHVSDNYLSLNGGVMKGDIGLDGNDIYGSWYRIRNSDDNSFIGLSGGGSHTWETSSTLVLFGNNAGDNAGRAVLNSHGHNLAVCQNGQLLFDNQNIVRSVNGVNADASGNVDFSNKFADWNSTVVITSVIKALSGGNGYAMPFDCMLNIFSNSQDCCFMLALAPNLTISQAESKGVLLHAHLTTGICNILLPMKKGQCIYSLTDKATVIKGNMIASITPLV